ncbi:hypothetical protein [Aquipuribacter sp. MA13-6]|uniref:hypothetical protein n=1 Tax=unclassified Aquipuribacter TaxID=2635084 RepID=UPI003EEE48A0
MTSRFGRRPAVGPRGPSGRSPLRDAAPGPARWAGAVAAASAVVGLGLVGGVSPERSALLAAAAAVAVLAVRVAGDDLTWPPRPARRTRPGWHGVATTLRQLEGARTDGGDRATLRARLARLERDGPHPAAGAVRAVVGGAATTGRRNRRPRTPTDRTPTDRTPTDRTPTDPTPTDPTPTDPSPTARTPNGRSQP